MIEVFLAMGILLGVQCAQEAQGIQDIQARSRVFKACVTEETVELSTILRKDVKCAVITNGKEI